MGTIISIIVGVIAIFAFLSYIATPKGEDAEENAKAGAAAGAYFLLSIAPTVITTSNPQLSSSASFLRLNVLSSLN